MGVESRTSRNSWRRVVDLWPSRRACLVVFVVPSRAWSSDLMVLLVPPPGGNYATEHAGTKTPYALLPLFESDDSWVLLVAAFGNDRAIRTISWNAERCGCGGDGLGRYDAIPWYMDRQVARECISR